MSIDLSRFRNARKVFSQRYREAVMQEATRRANRLADDLANRTPVDTGSAKDSWNVGVGEADLSYKDRSAHFNPIGEPEGTRIPELPGVAPWGSDLHVSNNVPYIQQLNAGSSKQAPAAFVELTIAEHTAGVEK